MAFTERLRAVPPTVRNVNVECTGLGLEAADEDTATIRTGVMYGGFIRVVFLVKSLYMDGDIAFVGIDIVDVDSAESRTDIQTVVDRGDRRRKRRYGGVTAGPSFSILSTQRSVTSRGCVSPKPCNVTE